MKKTPLIALGATGLCAAGAAALAVSLKSEEPHVSLYHLDLPGEEESATRRSWRSAAHLSHHLRELLALTIPLSAVYLTRAIDPGFRERIMLVTAMANECSW